MKVLFLGGAGDMAVEALRELNREAKRVELVTIVDLDPEKARKKVGDLGLAIKTEIEGHDLFDRDWLVAKAGDHDVVLNFAGPFYTTEKYAAEAALAAKKPYVSISDDYDAYLEVVKLDDEARKAGKG